MEYGRIVRRAFDITWKHKVLWIFGVVLAIFEGGSGSLGQTSQMVQYRLGDQDLGLTALMLMLFLLLALVFFVVGVIVRYTSYGALIHMVQGIEERQETSTRAGLAGGWKRFLQLFALDLIIGVASSLIVVVVLLFLFLTGGLLSVPAILAFRAGDVWVVLGIIWAIVFGLLFLALLVLSMLAITALVASFREMAFRYCVIQSEGVSGALRAAWDLVGQRWREILPMWLLLALVRIALGIVVVPLFFFLVLAIGLGAWVLRGAEGWWIIGLIIGLPLALVTFAVALLVQGFGLAFQSAAWTLTFRELVPQAPLA